MLHSLLVHIIHKTHTHSHTVTGTHTHTRTHTHEPLVVTAFIDMAFMWVSSVNAATAR